MKILTFALAILIAGAVSGLAQTQDFSYWVSVTPPDEPFSVLMPQAPSVKTEKSGYGTLEVDGQVYSVTENDAVYTLWSLTNRTYRNVRHDSVEDYLDECADLVWESLLKPRREKLEKERMGMMAYQQEVKAGELAGRLYFLRLGPKQGAVRFFVDEEKIYVLLVYNANPASAEALRFLSSFQPDRDKASAQGAQPDNTDKGSGQPKLIQGPGRGGNTPGGDEAQANAPGPVDYDRVFKGRETTEKARIFARPEPQYSESARKYQVTGTVILEAVLAKTGEVTDVRVVKSLPHGLTRNSIEATKRIRFFPAKKDGITVSQSIVVEYNFNLY